MTEGNLEKADKTMFLTRLPATYNECGRVVRQAVNTDDWIDIGPLAEEQNRPKRPAASYKAYDSTVELYGKTYRAIVVHSSAHDKRRHKKIDRLLKQDRSQLEKACKQVTGSAFFCRADAQMASEKLIHTAAGGCHRVMTDIEKVSRYGRGRPVKNKPRTVLHYEYRLTAKIVEAPEKVDPLRLQAGCFVLITNLIGQQDEWPATDLLKLYKSQIGIEKNFSFLKDPAVVNSIFLKKAERIEALGLILLDLPADLAFNGTCHAPVCGSKRLYINRLETTADKETNLFYDDNQVFRNNSHNHGYKPSTGTAVKRFSIRVSASYGGIARSIHSTVECRKLVLKICIMTKKYPNNHKQGCGMYVQRRGATHFPDFSRAQ